MTLNTTAADIVRSIRATSPDGSPALSDSEAELMVNLFASIAAVQADVRRDRLRYAVEQIELATAASDQLDEIEGTPELMGQEAADEREDA